MEIISLIMEYISSMGTMLFAALILSLPALATIHVLMTRDEPRAAMAWFGFVWFVPVLGVAFYLLFGMKRIERRARLQRLRQGLEPRPGLLSGPKGIILQDILPKVGSHWQMHSVLSERVCHFSLATDNNLTLLPTGQAAYKAMIDSIDAASASIALSSYIFQADEAGEKIVEALIRAKARGVEIRVLIDAVGNWYGFKPVSKRLRKHNIKVAFFNPARLSWRLAFFNLRTHRKILVIDGMQGFVGGMNIRKYHISDPQGVLKVRDTHFKITGSAVGQLMYSFADDWAYSTSEVLTGSTWFPENLPPSAVKAESNMLVRSIPDGPDSDERKTMLVLASAVSAAQKFIYIQTPYFVPGETLLLELKQAAMRGVKVCLLLPRRSNLRFVDWASWVTYRSLMSAGVIIKHGAAPFDHSKLMAVDDIWAMIGSSNWDSRSLLLNFEFNMEIYDAAFSKTIKNRIKDNAKDAITLTEKDIQARPWYRILRDKFVWLASPYL